MCKTCKMQYEKSLAASEIYSTRIVTSLFVCFKHNVIIIIIIA